MPTITASPRSNPDRVASGGYLGVSDFTRRARRALLAVALPPLQRRRRLQAWRRFRSRWHSSEHVTVWIPSRRRVNVPPRSPRSPDASR